MPENTLSGEFELSESTPGGESLSTPVENTPLENNDIEIKKPKEKTSSHFYSSYCYYPKNIRFINQEKDEEIILLVRRRFIVNLPWIISGILLAILGPIIFPLALNSMPIFSINPSQLFIILAIYFLILFGFFLTKFTLWYFHVGIITNKRIKDIDIHGILFKDIAETRINLIQDVKYKQIGFIPSLFNFGDVFVQTAGAEPNIEFDKAPMPAKITKIIGDMLKHH